MDVALIKSGRKQTHNSKSDLPLVKMEKNIQEKNPEKNPKNFRIFFFLFFQMDVALVLD